MKKRLLVAFILLFGLPLVAITYAWPPTAPQTPGGGIGITTPSGIAHVLLAAGSPMLIGGDTLAIVTGVSGTDAAPTVLTVATTNGIAIGDAVIITAGTQVNVGTYICTAVAVDTTVTLDRNASSGGAISAASVTYVNDPIIIESSSGAGKPRIVLPSDDDFTTPTLGFGDGDTGFTEYSDDNLYIGIGGVARYYITTAAMGASAGSGAIIKASGSTETNPTLIPYGDDTDTGIGGTAANQLSLIAGATELARAIKGTTDGFTRTLQRLYPAALTDTGTPHALTVNELWDTLITTQGWNGNDDIEFTLPDISSYVTGSPVLKVKFLDSVGEQDGDADFYIDPDGSTQIVLDGVITGTDGDRIWNDNSPIYSSIVCHSEYDPTLAGYWVCDTINGTFADKGN